MLESIERDDAADLVKRYGGRVTGNISKKTSYVVLGEGAGESKTNKVRKETICELLYWRVADNVCVCVSVTVCVCE